MRRQRKDRLLDKQSGPGNIPHEVDLESLNNNLEDLKILLMVIIKQSMMINELLAISAQDEIDSNLCTKGDGEGTEGYVDAVQQIQRAQFEKDLAKCSTRLEMLEAQFSDDRQFRIKFMQWLFGGGLFMYVLEKVWDKLW